MNGTEGERPLVALSAAEQALALERLRGEVWQELTRLDEVQKAHRDALILQATEYERRLGDLNHEAARIKTAQSESISQDKFDGYKEANDQRIKKLEVVAERMWLPIVLVGGAAAGIGAAVVKLLFP